MIIVVVEVSDDILCNLRVVGGIGGREQSLVFKANSLYLCVCLSLTLNHWFVPLCCDDGLSHERESKHSV